MGWSTAQLHYNTMDNITTVSYTHLDVYKRQAQGRHHLAHLERGQRLEGKQVVLRALVQPAVAGLELSLIHI